MSEVTRSKADKWAGWVTAIVAIAGILMVIGSVYSQVCASVETNFRQDNSIAKLERDVAVMKATTTRMADDIEEIKADVKILIRRPQHNGGQ